MSVSVYEFVFVSTSNIIVFNAEEFVRVDNCMSEEDFVSSN